MLITAAAAALGLVLLFFGGEWLVRGASALAVRIGVSPLAIGLTVVAFGTSAPELVVSLQAALSGANDISVGNVVGSNIANIALILGAAALIQPLTAEAKIVRVDLPLMIIASFALLAILADDRASRLEGGMLAICVVGYTVFTFWESRRESEQVKEEFASAVPAELARRASEILLVLGGLGSLIVGGHLLVTSAVELARGAGIGEAAIGLTLVAVGTSLPELATTLVAARRGMGDLAIGGIVGSNLFNILGILGTTAIVRPLARGGIGWIDLSLMAGLACVLTAILYGRGRLGRVEGAVMLGFYLLYTGWKLTA